MRRRAALALAAFAMAMACFGILARAVDGAGIALVKTAGASAQTIDDTAADANGERGAASGSGAAPSATDYASCIPIEALHQEGPSLYFVYVLEERSGFLGTEWAVRKAYVSVLDTGGGFAALADGALSAQQQVVVRSNRVIEDGDRARAIDG